ncbi:MAG: hypothetical protein DME12_03955 [Candidatus Rokuibacteriota bacterium]|nr:MAG: hypothetical protein DME12_03955 [Candidatus Rokubacteria bacterium]PYM67473.1 MAG: hypothetical protein DME11_03755 [Candidatus Rokubacteria bacterium]PYN66604.1 MAG: hypothetical protein DMD93_16995 [Candidatus Rokubacteria bacterium]
MTRRVAWLAVVLLGVGSALAAPPGAPHAADPTPDAQMLLDLDLLKDADLARDRNLLTRMRLVERLRVLETLPVLDSETPTGAPSREVKRP